MWSSYLEEYKKLQNKLADVYVDEGSRLIDKWSIQIKDATIEASELHDDALTLKKWERNIGILKAQIFRMKLKLSE